jgi:invasion protein IalB
MRLEARQQELLMRSLVLMFAAAAVVTPAASGPAFAQAQQQQPSTKKAADPNEVVCEKQEETGSRLSSHRVCMTRSQWAEQRRADRLEIDKAQTQRDLNHPQ